MLSLDYNKRIDLLDGLLSFFSGSDYVKWLVLSTLHYTIIPILYIVLLTTKSKQTFGLISIVAIVQIYLNYVDKGCFLMKLERKYVGKNWYGPYGLIPNMSREMIQPLFIIAMGILVSLGIYKGYKLFIKNK